MHNCNLQTQNCSNSEVTGQTNCSIYVPENHYFICNPLTPRFPIVESDNNELKSQFEHSILSENLKVKS